MGHKSGDLYHEFALIIYAVVRLWAAVTKRVWAANGGENLLLHLFSPSWIRRTWQGRAAHIMVARDQREHMPVLYWAPAHRMVPLTRGSSPAPSYVSLNIPEHPEECFRYFSIQYNSHDSLSQCINTTVRILQLGSVSPPALLFKIDSLGYFVSFTFPTTLRAHLAVTIPQAVILIGAALNL